MLVPSLRLGELLWGFAHPAAQSVSALLMQQPVCIGYVPSRYVAAAEAFNVPGNLVCACKMPGGAEAYLSNMYLLGLDPY